ncbi:hypothetical protein [Cohnella luojiensis]|uniref:Uncharacterized protein n=1 Tax=Cohnella luojiensis TaxID=652876 RepID=A0A4Y8M2A0_9BACL|nr:hypothetical protein [Cohnella luojiensis]TFE28169.1 hypothetical protein E2980_08110 [Cohnella luojiensis]
MRDRRLKRIIMWCVCIALAIGICGVISADYAVNGVMESFAEGMETDIPEAAVKEEPRTPVVNEGQPSTPSSAESAAANPEKDVTGAEKPTEEPTGQPIGKRTGDVTGEKVNNVRESLTVSDKATVVSVVLKNLSLTDLKKMRSIAQGGLTVEEKREAKRMMLSKLSPEEYNKLSALAKKYGISRGKTYDEAKQENP